MQRIVRLDANAAYYDDLQAAIKSFLRFNPGWQVNVTDIGLTSAQRGELRRIARVERGQAGPVPRWPQFGSRLESLAGLADRATLVLQLDADTLTFGSIEPWVDEFCGSKAAVSGVGMQPLSRFIRSAGLARRIFRGYDNWRHWLMLNLGVMLIRPRALRLLTPARLNMVRKHAGLFRIFDQVAFLSIVYDGGGRPYPVDRIYNCFVFGKNEPATLLEPPVINHERVVVAHTPVPRYDIHDPSGRYYIRGRWWRDIVARYKERPWMRG